MVNDKDVIDNVGTTVLMHVPLSERLPFEHKNQSPRYDYTIPVSF